MRGRGARLGSETFRLGHIDAGAFGIDIVRRRHTTARHRARIVGFQEGQAVQPAGALLSIDVCTTIIPGLIFIAVAFLMKLHPINKKNYARIIDALERRSAGDEINMSAFADIYGKDMKSGK